MNEFSFESYRHQEEKTEEIKIGDKTFLLTNKPSGNIVSYEIKKFIRDEWEKPRDEFNPNLEKALGYRVVDSIVDNNKKIVAVCAYAIGWVNDDGKIDLTLVQKDYRHKNGIGLFLTKHAVDKIIEFAEKKKGFKLPVKICADAETQEGFNMLKNIEQEYNGRVLFEIEGLYKDGYEGFADQKIY